MLYNPIVPYLDYSESTGRVYIVMSENKKIDVTAQFEDIAREKSIHCLYVKCDDSVVGEIKELLKKSESVILSNDDTIDFVKCKECTNRGDSHACPMLRLVHDPMGGDY